MRASGFEPVRALSHRDLNAIRLTTPAHPLFDINERANIK